MKEQSKVFQINDVPDVTSKAYTDMESIVEKNAETVDLCEAHYIYFTNNGFTFNLLAEGGDVPCAACIKPLNILGVQPVRLCAVGSLVTPDERIQIISEGGKLPLLLCQTHADDFISRQTGVYFVDDEKRMGICLECDYQGFGKGAALETLNFPLWQLVLQGTASMATEAAKIARIAEEQGRQEAARIQLAWEQWEQAARRLLPPDLVQYATFGKVEHHCEPSNSEYIPIEIEGFQTFGFTLINNNGYRLKEQPFTFGEPELLFPEQYPDYETEGRYRVEIKYGNQRRQVNDLPQALALAYALGQKFIALEAEAEAENKKLDEAEEKRLLAKVAIASNDEAAVEVEKPLMSDEAAAEIVKTFALKYGPLAVGALMVASVEYIAKREANDLDVARRSEYYESDED